MIEQYFLSYNKENIFKNLIQAEDHLKNLDEEGFNQCSLKHLSFAEAEADEAISHSLIIVPGKTEKFKELRDNIREARKEVQEGKADPKGTTLRVRKLRRQFESFNKDYDTSQCKSCGEIGKNKTKVIKNPTKDLNNPSTFNNQLNKKTKNDMAKKYDFMELGMVNAGQFVAEGIKYLLDTYPTTEPGKHSQIGKLGGGAVLQVLPMAIRMPGWAKSLLLVSGSNLLADGVVEMVKGTTAATVVRAPAPVPVVASVSQGQGNVTRFGLANGRQFGGMVTASGVPTQYARAGILAGAQAYEAPEHADLIRVD